MTHRGTAAISAAVALVVLLAAAFAAAAPFVAHVVSPLPPAPTELTLRDMDEDGDLDLVASVAQGIVWFENQGGGNFSSAYDIATGLGTLDIDRLAVVGDRGNTRHPYIAAASSVPGEPAYAVVVAAAPGVNAETELLQWSPRKIPMPTAAVALAVMPETVPGLLPGVVAVQPAIVQVIVPTDSAGDTDQPSGSWVAALIDTGTAGALYERALVGRFTDTPADTGFDTDILLLSDAAGYLLRRDPVAILTWNRQAEPALTGMGDIEAVIAGDMDGDSLLDLVVFTGADQQLRYLHNDWVAGVGPLTFSATLIGAAGDIRGCTELVVADVDGDGLLDIVALDAPYGGGGAVVLRATATGVWAAPVALPVPPAVTLAPYGYMSPTGMAVGDIDGDGDVDVMISSAMLNNVWEYLNDGAGGFVLRGQLNVMNAAAPAIVRPFFPTAASRAGLPDLLAMANASVLLHAVNRLVDRRVFEIQGGNAVENADATTEALNTYFFSPADVDNDGDDDVLATAYLSGLALLFRNDGTGALHYDAATSLLAAAGVAPGTIHAHLLDLDGDGYRDVIIGSLAGAFWMRNGGAAAPGEFDTSAAGRRWLLGPSATPAAYTAVSIGGMTWGDFDGDNRTDVVLVTFIGETILVLYQDAAPAPVGQFSSAALSLGSYGTAGFCAVAGGDLNSDGYADIAYTAAASGVLLNGGAAAPRNFSLPGITLAATGAGRSIKVVDLDRDNRNDLLIGTDAASDVIWLRGNGQASFASPVQLAATGLQGAGWMDVLDLDGDGDLDLTAGYSLLGASRWLEQQSAAISVTYGGDLQARAPRVKLNTDTAFSLLVSNAGPDPAFSVAISTVFGAGLRGVSWTCQAVVASSDSAAYYNGSADLHGYGTQPRCLASSGQNVLDGLLVDLPANTAVNITFAGHVSREPLYARGTAAAHLGYDDDDYRVAFVGSGDDTVAVSVSVNLGDSVLAAPGGTASSATELRVDTCPHDDSKTSPGVCGCGHADRKDVGGNVQCNAFVGSGGFVALLVIVPLAVVCCMMLVLLLAAIAALIVVAVRSRRHEQRKILTPPVYARLAYDLSNVDMASIDDYLRRLGPFLDIAALMDAFDALMLDPTFFAALIASLPPLQQSAAGAIAADQASNASTSRGTGEVPRGHLATALVYAYHAHDQADMLLRMLLRAEPRSVMADFREDDMFSTTYRTYTKIVALRWLWNGIALPLNELTERVLEDLNGGAGGAGGGKHYGSGPSSASATTTSGGKFGGAKSTSGGSSIAHHTNAGSSTRDQSQELDDDEDGGDDGDSDAGNSGAVGGGGDVSPRPKRRHNKDATSSAAATSDEDGRSAGRHSSKRSDPRSATSHLTQLNVHVAVQTMLMRITSSADAFPDELRMVLQACRKTTTVQSPTATQAQQQQLVVGPLVGLLFNRFICPAIVQPRQYGLIGVDEHLNSEQKKALASAAKLLLTYATGTGAAAEFGSAPIPGDQLMFTNHMRVREFLDAVSSDSYASDVDATTATHTTASAWGVDSTVDGSGIGIESAATRKKLLLGAQESLDLRTGPPAGRVPPGVRLDALKIIYVHCARTKGKLTRAIRKQLAKQQQPQAIGASGSIADQSAVAAAAEPAAAAAEAGRRHKHDLATRFKRLVDSKYLAAAAEQHKKKKKRRNRRKHGNVSTSSSSLSQTTTSGGQTTMSSGDEKAADGTNVIARGARAIDDDASGSDDDDDDSLSSDAPRRTADVEMGALAPRVLGDESVSDDDDDNDDDDGDDE